MLPQTATNTASADIKRSRHAALCNSLVLCFFFPNTHNNATRVFSSPPLVCFYSVLSFSLCFPSPSDEYHRITNRKCRLRTTLLQRISLTLSKEGVYVATRFPDNNLFCFFFLFCLYRYSLANFSSFTSYRPQMIITPDKGRIRGMVTRPFGDILNNYLFGFLFFPFGHNKYNLLYYTFPKPSSKIISRIVLM